MKVFWRQNYLVFRRPSFLTNFIQNPDETLWNSGKQRETVWNSGKLDNSLLRNLNLIRILEDPRWNQVEWKWMKMDEDWWIIWLNENEWKWMKIDEILTLHVTNESHNLFEIPTDRGLKQPPLLIPWEFGALFQGCVVPREGPMQSAIADDRKPDFWQGNERHKRT